MALPLFELEGEDYNLQFNEMQTQRKIPAK